MLPAHPSGPPAGGRPTHGTKAIVLPHVGFNKKTGKYVQRHLQSACNMDISVKFDQEHCNLLRREHRIPELDTNTFDNQALFPARKTAAIADTGASVDCSGIDILKMLGIGRRALLPTSTILRTANKQRLTVLGTIPVTVSTKSVDKETVVTERVLIYVVKELRSIFLSKDTLVEMSVIPPYFPMPPPRRKYGEVAGLKGTSTDTIAKADIPSY